MPVINRVPGLIAPGVQYLPLSGPGTPAAGQTVLTSGGTTVTVSTTLARSNAIVQILSTLPASVGTNSAGYILVSSLVQGVSFAFARNNGVGAGWSETINWRIFYPTAV